MRRAEHLMVAKASQLRHSKDIVGLTTSGTEKSFVHFSVRPIQKNKKQRSNKTKIASVRVSQQLPPRFITFHCFSKDLFLFLRKRKG